MTRPVRQADLEDGLRTRFDTISKTRALKITGVSGVGKWMNLLDKNGELIESVRELLIEWDISKETIDEIELFVKKKIVSVRQDKYVKHDGYTYRVDGYAVLDQGSDIQFVLNRTNTNREKIAQVKEIDIIRCPSCEWYVENKESHIGKCTNNDCPIITFNPEKL